MITLHTRDGMSGGEKMNRYLKNIFAITFITIFSLIVFTTWLDLKFGYAQSLLIIGAGYAIYLNLKEYKQKGEKT